MTDHIVSFMGICVHCARGVAFVAEFVFGHLHECLGDVASVGLASRDRILLKRTNVVFVNKLNTLCVLLYLYVCMYVYIYTYIYIYI